MPRSSDPTSLEYALELDAQDKLAAFRSEFIHADPGLIYLDGNSLGRMPRRSAELIDAAGREQWGRRLIRSWGEGWYEAPRRIGDKIGRLVGAGPGQVVVTDSTSVNLYKVVMAALGMRPGRHILLSDRHNFPSDLYILQGCALADAGCALADAVGARQLRLAEEGGDPTSAVLEALDEDTALVTLSLVAFKSGYLYDAAAVAERARQVGALVIWDLSHASGAVPVELDAWGADFAVGCTYKYLNGGPGAPAFLYANRTHLNEAISPIWGWFGEENPFTFDLEYHPAGDISRFQVGTPAMLSMLAIEPGVDLLLEAGMEQVRSKSVRQTGYLIDLYDRFLAPLGYELGTPRSPDQRGGHVSLRHAEGYRINQALIQEMDVLPDFREPDHIRLGLSPLYTTYQEVWEAVQRLARVMIEKRYLGYSNARSRVT